MSRELAWLTRERVREGVTVAPIEGTGGRVDADSGTRRQHFYAEQEGREITSSVCPPSDLDPAASVRSSRCPPLSFL
jgi:hypothetical protein